MRPHQFSSLLYVCFHACMDVCTGVCISSLSMPFTAVDEVVSCPRGRHPIETLPIKVSRHGRCVIWLTHTKITA